ncbi:unnamed protein product [Echinostoma caproni]|uniref:WD_REPEATS_REGION domain-containing protein n=1 Tax=Echinostoma caproni TaxID=27848 RepID=A0A183ACG7_9TREM|nr:unnamed protein product [Echinostoma caproni]
MLNPLNDRTGFVNAAGELIYVWSISSGSGAPKHQLYCPGLSETGLRGANITRAIFSPDTDASMVVGGLADGSLCIWDLRASRFGMCPTRNDPVRSSDSDQSDYRRIMFAKAPIYSTSGVDIQLVTSTQSAFMDSKSKLHEAESRRRCSTNEVHRQHYYRAQSQHHSVPIVDVQLTPSARCDPCLTTFQFAALDESGELSLWMVLRPARSTVYNIYESLAGSQTDLGLRPAEHVVQMVCLAYLIPTLPLDFELGDWSTMEGVEEVGDQMLPLRDKPKINATTLALSGSGDFLLGFNNGAIVRLSRSSKQSVYPRQFGQPWNRAAVRCLAVHSIAEFKFFLAGYADGFIRMYHINQPEPVYERNICDICDCQLSAVKLIWSTSRPSIFFCLDSSGRITSLDMVEVLHEGNMDEEIDCAQKHTMASVNQGLVIHVPSAKLEQQRVYDFALSRGVLVSSNGQTQIMSAFALIYPEAVKIHWLDSQWSHGTGEELKLTRDRFSQL